MNEYGENWLINIICLKENKSYIICSNEDIKHDIAKLFNTSLNNKYIILKPAFLRKEIIKKGLEYSRTN